MTINCGSQEINILRATYGRTHTSSVCGGPVKTTWCHAGSSMRVARHRCQSQRSCTLHALNSAFGDPCFGTKKYLEVSSAAVLHHGKKHTVLSFKLGGIMECIEINAERRDQKWH